jgi:hypothetical protein
MNKVRLGLWVDLPRRPVLTNRFFDWFVYGLKFDVMAIMIDQSDKKVNFSWRPIDLERALLMGERYGVSIGVTTWPYPDINHLVEMERKMREILSIGPFLEWETDQEFNWNVDEVFGFERGLRGYKEAGKQLIQIKKELCSEYRVKNTMTTFTNHRENSARETVASEHDLLLVQAYAVHERNGKPIPYGHRYGPLRMADTSLNRTSEIKGVGTTVKVGVGHAAWKQTKFKQRGISGYITPEVAMKATFDVAKKHSIGVEEHRWWSAKFCYPHSKRYNRYSENFLKTVAKSTTRP